MNPLPPPTEALDEQEREFARILRALPAGEPSPALDAKILRSAANAAASSRRPEARWLASAASLWGIGGAAAAVLALGVGLQVLVGDPPRAERASAPATMSDGGDEAATAVEFKEEPRRESESVSPPSESTPAAPAPRRQPAPQMATPVVPAPAAAEMAAPEPQAFSEDRLDEHVATRPEMRADQGSSASGLAAAAPAAPVAAPTDSAGGAPMAKAAAATRANAAPAQVSGALERDREPRVMKPSTWLAEIRQLRDARQTAQARESLLEFRKRYPTFVIPSDLEPLLRE